MNISPLVAFGLGPPEIILIFLVLLLLFGAKKLPELARGIGKSTGEFKRAREEFEREIKISETEVTKPSKPATEEQTGFQSQTPAKGDFVNATSKDSSKENT